MKNSIHLLSLVICFFLYIATYAQVSVWGTVKDIDGNPIEAVSIICYVKSIDTDGKTTEVERKFLRTNSSGEYNISVEKTPFTLEFTHPKYKIFTTEDILNVGLIEAIRLSPKTTMSSSRTTEYILESPVTLEIVDSNTIRHSDDYYDELLKLKGVYGIQASLNFTSINARGFAPHGNIRFVQLQDGMNDALASTNFSFGNIFGISPLDIEKIELIPGASSALYGPNAFNGIISMESKNPFKYEGLSAQVKAGITNGSVSTDPFYGASVRYAEAFGNEFAYKFNFSMTEGKDWSADDYSSHRINQQMQPDILPTFGDYNFDGINRYGDEIAIPLTGVRRTGWKEEDLLSNRDAKSYNFDAALHRRVKNIEAMVSYKYGQGTSIYQNSGRFVLPDFTQQFIKFEVKSDDKWNILGYKILGNSGDYYSLTALGTSVNEALFPSNGYVVPEGINIGNDPTEGGWFGVYRRAMAGVFSSVGIPGGDAAKARAFADAGGLASLSEDQMQLLLTTPPFAGITDPDDLDFFISSLTGIPGYDENGNLLSTDLDSIRDNIIENVRNTSLQEKGAKFADDSRLSHIEGNYDLSGHLNDWASVQIGANWRLYNLFSEGTIFNEDPEGTGENKRIRINERGAYIQASKKIINDKLKLRVSLRYDKSKNFEGQISPRISAVYNIKDNPSSSIRASYQTGFRNPSSQEQYIYFPGNGGITLGGAEANAERYGIYENSDGAYGAWTLDSYIAYTDSLQNIDLYGTQESIFLASEGAKKLLDSIGINYVQPERLKAFDIGYNYQGTFNNNTIFFDINCYYNIYTNFIVGQPVISRYDTDHKGQPIPAGSLFSPYFNAPFDARTFGITGGIKYNRDKWELKGNFSYNNFSLEDPLPDAFKDFKGSFNIPKFRANLGVADYGSLVENIFLTANLKWQSEFEWASPFEKGTIPTYYVIDAQIGYTMDKISFKLGINNIAKRLYITNYGGPGIGRMIHLSITYNNL